MVHVNRIVKIMRRMLVCSFIVICMLTLSSTAIAQGDSGKKEIKYGTAYDSIGTFNGWTFWVGWDGAFSETYEPKSETYAWVLYFAPEAIYVTLQNAKSVYSNVDVNAGFDYFYGLLYSPTGDKVTRSYIDSLLGVSLSINTFDSSMVPTGPLSQLSIALTSGQTLFRVGKSKKLERALQYSAGMNTSFSLMPISIPAGVSLEYESQVAAGFYPIVIWGLNNKPQGNPNNEIIAGLQKLASNDGQTFIDIYLSQMAQQLLPFMQTIPLSQEVDDFISGKGSKSRIYRLIEEAEQWLQSGDTKNVPDNIKPPMDPKTIYVLLKPVQSATNSGFEVGYKRGYDSKDRDDTIYANCIETINAEVGKPIQIVVTADEIVKLLPGSKASDFEGIGVIFDNPPESYIATTETETTIELTGGKAIFEFATNTDMPLILGVRVNRCEETGDKTLELCRRKIVF